MKHLKYPHFIVAFPLASFSFALAVGANKVNETLLCATSPFEDIVEVALAKNEAKISKLRVTADTHVKAVREALPASATIRFDSLLQVLHKAVDDKEHFAVARGEQGGATPGG